MSAMFILLLLATTCVCSGGPSYTYTTVSRRVKETATNAGSNDRRDYQLLDPEAIRKVANAASDLSWLIYEHLQNGSSRCADHMGLLFKTYRVIEFQNHKLNFNVSINVSQGQLAMDASGKPVPEILLGNIRFRGSYDECINIDTPFYMQYVELPLFFVFHDSTNDEFPYPTTESFCLPELCTIDDINGTLQTINKLIMDRSIPLKMLIKWDGEMFMKATQRDVQYSAGAIVMIFISCLFVAMAGIGSAYDLYCYTKRSQTNCLSVNNELEDESNQSLLKGVIKKESHHEGLLTELLLSFSLYKTVPALLSTNQPPSAITCINGMRVISMFWIIMSHSYSVYSDIFKNLIYMYIDFPKRFSAQPILNRLFAIDSFFFLSGLLVAYLTFREMERKRGRFPVIAFYVHRIARLTPVYMYMLFLYMYVAFHITNGPELQDTLGKNSTNYKKCADSWWSNLLYINNFYPKYNKLCMGWSWYLADDMQFYVISPLFILPLFYYFPVGISSLVLCLLSSIGVTGFIAGYYGYNDIDLAATGDHENPNLSDPRDQIYVKPYCRIMPYLVGLFLGFLLYKKQKVSIPSSDRFTAVIYSVIWVVAIVPGILIVYGLYPSFNGYTPTKTGNVIYYMFSNFTFGVSLALVVYACHNGFGGIVNRFLSLPFWIPLGRLTYTAYLVHEVVLLLLISEMRDGFYFSNMVFAVHVLSIVVLSFGGALAVSLLVEFPISNVERAIFKFFGNPLRASSRIPAKK